MSELLPDAAGAVGEALEDDEEAGALLEPEAAGALLEPEAGALLEPLAALPLGAGAALELELDAPPEAPEAGALGVAALELDELLSLSLLLASTDAEPDTELEPEPDGAVDAEPDGEVLEPADEDDEPGAVLLTVRSPSLSQPVSSPAPSARDTAAARMESLM